MTKLVVVDDENEIVTMIERFFSRQEGYQVKTFTNPVTAHWARSSLTRTWYCSIS
jgi:DNA-binding response OmpR family regulator